MSFSKESLSKALKDKENYFDSDWVIQVSIQFRQMNIKALKMHFVECKESFVCHFWSNDALHLVVCLERKKYTFAVAVSFQYTNTSIKVGS